MENMDHVFLNCHGADPNVANSKPWISLMGENPSATLWENIGLVQSRALLHLYSCHAKSIVPRVKAISPNINIVAGTGTKEGFTSWEFSSA